MRFQRITIDTDALQLAALKLAAEYWLPQKAVNRTHVAVVAAMPAVATLYKRAATKHAGLMARQAQGLALPRGGKIRLWLTVPEAAAVMAYLSEQLLADEEEDAHQKVFWLRTLRGSIHQQLSAYDGLAYAT